MNLRYPIAAGMFYEGTPASCRHHAAKLIESAKLPADLPSPLYGGLAPHAGWAYSGKTAALTHKAVMAGGPVRTLVMLSAHVMPSVRAAQVYDSGVWRTPLGDVAVDAELAAALLKAGKCLEAAPSAHDGDHSLEVHLPLLQVLSADVKIVPIAVPPTPLAIEVGQVLGQVLTGQFPAVRVIGSTDLTHHAGHFPAPGGRGEAGAKWAEQNDRRMIDLAESLAGEKVVAEWEKHQNACGAGAVAAAITAVKALGAKRGLCLGYTNSYRIIHEQFPEETDDTTVGYAAVVFG